MKKTGKKHSSHAGRKELRGGQEAERREELVQHESNYNPKEEDADIEVARRHKSR